MFDGTRRIWGSTNPFWTAPLALMSTMSPTLLCVSAGSFCPSDIQETYLYCLKYVDSLIIPFFLKSREKAY